jgi:hypothetical protein
MRTPMRLMPGARPATAWPMVAMMICAKEERSAQESPLVGAPEAPRRTIINSIPYIFLRPYLSARYPNPSCPKLPEEE